MITIYLSNCRKRSRSWKLLVVPILSTWSMSIKPKIMSTLSQNIVKEVILGTTNSSSMDLSRNNRPNRSWNKYLQGFKYLLIIRWSIEIWSLKIYLSSKMCSRSLISGWLKTRITSKLVRWCSRWSGLLCIWVLRF